jgi:Neurotransmitter-gated ion-channel ligand binding domain
MLGMGSFAVTGLFLILVTAARPSVHEDGTGELSPPSADGRPVEVAIGFYALDFARVTAREESFDVTGYLELSWRDPRLALPGAEGPNPGTRRVDAGTIWTPRLLFENALEPPRYHGEPVVEADEHGLVTSWAVLSGKFSAPMDLRRFPFDRQVLRVRIGAFDDESVVRFAVKRELVIVDEEATVSDWTVGSPRARVDVHRYVPGQEAYPRYEYAVGLQRRSTFYIWRVMVPLTLLAAVSWAAFWFEPVGLQPQISTCMAALIALVAFNFAVDFALPKVDELTLIDRHALIGFGFVAVTGGRLPVARSIQRVARRAFPPAYALAVSLNLGLLDRWTP